MTFTCKLCNNVVGVERMAKARRNMCKDCYKQVVFYNRMMQSEDWSDAQRTRFDAIEKLFNESHIRGGYVPNRFLLRSRVRVCSKCKLMYFRRDYTFNWVCWYCKDEGR